MTPLPEVVRKPALLKLWLVDFSPRRIIILSVLLVILLLADQLSQGLVDHYYPLDTDSFSTTLKDLFNSPSLRKIEALRADRSVQIYIAINLVVLLVLVIVLLVDLPQVLRKGEDKAQQLIEHSDSILESNPELARTLVIEATQYLLSADNYARTVRLDESISPVHNDFSNQTAKMNRVSQPRFVGPKQRYRIIKPLARGGAGIVYEAEDRLLQRSVALKELFIKEVADPEQTERFKVEARALAKLNHAHILPVYDLLENDDHFWLVMELLKGGTLGDRIKKSGKLEIDQSMEIVKGLAAGLGLAHKYGFVHRDIKPANILFGLDGAYRITDFGIAKSKTSIIKTQHGVVMGSPGYMSPEQASGEEVDARSDIYSLGITLYQMLTGKLPFVGDTSAVMAQQITQIPDKPSLSNQAISPGLESVIMKLLEKQADNRYQSAGELIRALNQLSR